MFWASANGRGNADEFAEDVEQRPAGVAAVNARVGLDQPLVFDLVVESQRAVEGADDARGHRVC